MFLIEDFLLFKNIKSKNCIVNLLIYLYKIYWVFVIVRF